jgi:polysaccharide export outer membrane protein
VQKTIEARLAEKALQPQALVIVERSAANTVTVLLNEHGGISSQGVGGLQDLVNNPLGPVATSATTGAGGSPNLSQATPGTGARVSLSSGGDRLLQVIAAAGGAKAPVHETFVRLSRGGMTATIPLRQLVSDPAEDIYAKPGDTLTLVRDPRTFSVFGATGRNAEIRFDSETITLAEALAKSQGLRDDLADPGGAFLFRYEPNSMVHALNHPVATRSQGGNSPVAYRFDFRDGKSYLLAQEFPVRDRDIIFVADAGSAQAQKLFTLLQNVTGPVITGLLVCRSSNTKC